MERQEFQAHIDAAIASLPEHIRVHVKDVIIVVEDVAKPGQQLLGLYEGVPLTHWGREFSGRLPDKITLFKEPIEQCAGAPEHVPYLIRETLLHEIAHFLGFDHPAIRRMERKWRMKRTQQ